jgi:hypothetical protein
MTQFDLAGDSGFRKQVSMAIATAAVAIAGEAKGAFSDVKYGKRQRLAYDVLANPTGLLSQFAVAVTQNAAVTLGASVNIASSTNALPSVVTTAQAHGLSTGAPVRIEGHLVNTAINGWWEVTVLTTTTFSVPVAGVGVGAATGRVIKLPIDSDVQFTVNSLWDDMAGVTGLD